MNTSETLGELCGIAENFIDARGETQTTSLKTRQALLKAMGVRSDDETLAQVALASMLADASSRCLPPVHVHNMTRGVLEIELGRRMSGTGKWRIELEGGGSMQGTHEPLAASGPGRVSKAKSNCLRLETTIPMGYHTLALDGDDAVCLLIVTPGQCWLPEGIEEGRKLWGMSAQLYLLRSSSNWGIGDYGDLRSLVQILGARGADVVGLNPLHAMFPDAPEQASPYSPASRLLLNVLNIDVDQVLSSVDCAAADKLRAEPSFEAALARCRVAKLVDYAGVAALKLPLLSELFRCSDRNAPEWQAFVAFREEAGATFERHCLFLALRSRFAAEAPQAADWHRWPEAYRGPHADGAVQFAKEHADAVTFQAWLQFVADRQLRACCDAAAGMAIGLYRDLAVGAAADGAETWANPQAVVDTAQVGAPPDIYNPQGQDWGLPPFNPQALRAEGYRSFIELVRANMRHAGGLRIDHVMALQQLYWIPRGHAPAEGAYVRYPLDDLVGILALESHRHQCLVVGEDLGTVPSGFRERMEQARILSYRVLFFEKDAQEFIVPEEYPPLALAVAGSHDLPTLRAWWQGGDLVLKEKLKLYPTAQHAQEARQERDADRSAVLGLLRRRDLLRGDAPDVEVFVKAAHSLLAATRSAVTVLQLDDVLGEVDPVNVPTTSSEHPNWRRRLRVSLEQIAADARFVAETAALGRQRRSGGDR